MPCAGFAGGQGWNRDEFLRVFPKDSARIERFEKRVETLKSIGYMSPSGRMTDQFYEHAKVKWGGRATASPDED